MARVLVLGGGFGGVVAAERLAKLLPAEHQLTLVSRDSRFVFYPALVRLAFGGCEPDDISFDLREAMLDRRVRFVEAEVARVNTEERYVRLAHGDIVGDMPYDYLIFALGRRLATESVPGFFEHAHHLLTVEAALEFGERVREFKGGHAVFGYCQGSRLAVPVYETAFTLAQQLEERGEREKVRISVVSPDSPGERMEGEEIRRALRDAFDAHSIEFMPGFPISRVTAHDIRTDGGLKLGYDLLMLVPPFQGSSATYGLESTDEENYLVVDRSMHVLNVERVYAAGDCVRMPGPKMGHAAVSQAEVAAFNVAAEIEGRTPSSLYDHDLRLVIDTGGPDSIYLHKSFWDDGGAVVKQGRFWRWAKWVHEKYWEGQHD